MATALEACSDSKLQSSVKIVCAAAVEKPGAVLGRILPFSAEVNPPASQDAAPISPFIRPSCIQIPRGPGNRKPHVLRPKAHFLRPVAVHLVDVIDENHVYDTGPFLIENGYRNVDC